MRMQQEQADEIKRVRQLVTDEANKLMMQLNEQITELENRMNSN